MSKFCSHFSVPLNDSLEATTSLTQGETKAKNEMDDDKVLAKADAAVQWCQHASEYLIQHGGKEWKYLLIPHNEVIEQNLLDDYVTKFHKNLKT